MWTPTQNYTLFLLILTIEIPAIKPTTKPRDAIATVVLNINSTGTKGCVSQVPGNVYTDGFDAKIISFPLVNQVVAPLPSGLYCQYLQLQRIS